MVFLSSNKNKSALIAISNKNEKRSFVEDTKDDDEVISLQSTNANSKHWSKNTYEIFIPSNELNNSKMFLSKLKGGSDNNQFVYVDSNFYSVSKTAKLNQFDIILEIHNFKVSGYTYQDVIKLFDFLLKSNDTIRFLTVKSQLSESASSSSASSSPPSLSSPSTSSMSSSILLPLELSKFLEESFQKGSIEYNLQQTIRDNVYVRLSFFLIYLFLLYENII